MPVERYSHGLRRLAAIESSRGSFEGAVEAIGQTTGSHVAKRQVEQLARSAATDVDDFYDASAPKPGTGGGVLVLSVDGKAS